MSRDGVRNCSYQQRVIENARQSGEILGFTPTPGSRDKFAHSYSIIKREFNKIKLLSPSIEIEIAILDDNNHFLFSADNWIADQNVFVIGGWLKINYRLDARIQMTLRNFLVINFFFFHYNLFLFSFSFFFHRGYIISVKKQFKITRPFQKWNASVYIYLYSHASKKVPRVQYNIYIYKSKKNFFSLYFSYNQTLLLPPSSYFNYFLVCTSLIC